MSQYEGGNYDVIVVGAGHAGCEAALASARMGLNTLIVTMNLEMVGFMPCNPAIGGPAKGVVVRELDALGGEMGRNIDRTYIQMRQLNTSKGPAVRALRAQADRNQYSVEMKHVLETTENLTIKQALVQRLVIEDGECRGVICHTGAVYRSQAVVLTNGTSSRGKIYMGDFSYESGPNNTLPSKELSEHLIELGLEIIRFKTGTPPRVHRDSLDFSKMEIQPGDEDDVNFSFMTQTPDDIEANEPCWLTHTNERTHQIIRDNIHRAPMFMGNVDTKGARYCPSIEDKIHRFSDKDRHQVFLEPEGLKTEEMYVQGLSTSLPEDVQIQFLRTIPGMENVEIIRPGYAIEYDVVAPHQLKLSLEVRDIPGLFTAGQMNGTSGYEEAAGQGIIAGINAARKVQGLEPLILKRNEAYIGVMIDDLVTKGTTEPYRLLTSRAEYRLLLRHDNADMRLTQYGYEIGLADQERYDRYLEKKALVDAELDRLKSFRFTPNTSGLDDWFERVESTPLQDGILAYDLLKRPEIKYQDLVELAPRPEGDLSHEIAEQIEISVKYEGYINKAERKVQAVSAMEDKQIPADIDYYQIDNLKLEARERLSEISPETLGQASRVSGVTASDVSVLQLYLQQVYPSLEAK